jgi:plasmid stabilization system protein ParE
MRVRYTRSAARELDKILTYIEERSPQGAQNVQARIQHVIGLISVFPELGRQSRVRPGIRRMSTKPYPYVIFYAVTEQEIIIRRIRHMARKPD